MSKSRLGKGLDALLSDSVKTNAYADAYSHGDAGGDGPTATQLPSNGAGVLTIAIDTIVPSPYQPRQIFDEAAIQELAQSIKAQGLLQPVVVRSRAQGGYELIAGERRWRAAQVAQLTEIPAIKREVSDREASALALIENIQREDLSSLEEAQGLERLRTEFELTQQELADIVGKSRATVANSLRLLTLGKVARKLLAEGSIDMGHGRALLSLHGLAQDRMALKVVKSHLSVRETEAMIRRSLASADKAKAETATDPDTQILQRRLMDHLGAKVQIKQKRNGHGELIVSYADLEQLQGILSRFHLPS